MKLSVKKLHVFVAIIMAVICITVGLSLADFNSIIGKADADTNAPIEDDFDYGISDDPTGGNSSGSSSSGGNSSKLVFTNAWQAYNYALAMEKKHKNYREYLWTVHGDAESFPVTIDYTGKRKIYDNLSEIYVVNGVETIIDVGNLGINIGAGKTFTSYTCFDLANGFVQISPTNIHSMKEEYEKYRITTYEIPYVINSSTAKAYLKDDPSKRYYELDMTLNSKAWGTYQEVLKDVIGNVEGLPKIQSIDIVIKIDKTTGRFISFDSTEKYSLVYNYNGIKASVAASGKVFVKYNYNKDISGNVAEMRQRVGLQ